MYFTPLHIGSDETLTRPRPDQCCLPKLCQSSICNSSQWDAKPGNVLSSTKEECCSPKDCDDYTCSGKFAKKQKRPWMWRANRYENDVLLHLDNICLVLLFLMSVFWVGMRMQLVFVGPKFPRRISLHFSTSTTQPSSSAHPPWSNDTGWMRKDVQCYSRGAPMKNAVSPCLAPWHTSSAFVFWTRPGRKIVGHSCHSSKVERSPGSWRLWDILCSDLGMWMVSICFYQLTGIPHFPFLASPPALANHKCSAITSSAFTWPAKITYLVRWIS